MHYNFFNYEAHKEIISRHWNNLTDEDLERTNGSLISIAGLIHQKYGEKKEAILSKIEFLCQGTGNTNNVQSKLTNAFDQSF